MMETTQNIQPRTNAAQAQKYDIKGDAKRAFDCVSNGGIAIVYYDVGYSILAATDETVKRVYAAKQRPWEKASAFNASREAAITLHALTPDQREMVRTITEEMDLPLSVVAPVHLDHPFVQKLTPFLRTVALRGDTAGLLYNAGELREAIAQHSWVNQVPIIVSSANRSSQGTKYSAAEIEPQVLEIADIVIDHGISRFNKFKSLSATQIDIRTMTLLRRGHFCDDIERTLKEKFDVVLKPKT